jgi:soluble P-type ATPase
MTPSNVKDVTRGIRIDIPGREVLHLEHLLLDVNGTIALDGEPLLDVWGRMQALSGLLEVHVVTADTFGTVTRWAVPWGPIILDRTAGPEDEQKKQTVENLGRRQAAAVGNGANDALMLKEAALGICVLGPEGAARDAFLAADVVVANICDALDLLLYPRRLVATLRR